MPLPLSPAELVEQVDTRFGRHPWARLCTGPAVPFEGGWDLGDAVFWRGGHPWSSRPFLHGLGGTDALRAAVATHGRPGDEVVCPVALLDSAPKASAHRWTLRLCDRSGGTQPGQDSVRWLPAADAPEVTALLDLANPSAAVRPADDLAGRWCGVRLRGRLVAVAVETVLAAPRGHLSSLSVAPTARGQGLGAAVTAWFVQQSLAAGAPEVLLGVDHGNAAAERLYDRLGFDAWPMGGFRLTEEG